MRSKSPNKQDQLDSLKLLLAEAVLEQSDLVTIRNRSLANLDRWNSNGVWCTAHDEWRLIMSSGSDEDVIAAMTGTDQKANRLRQSAPYAGLISEEKIYELIEKVGRRRPGKKAILAAQSTLNDDS